MKNNKIPYIIIAALVIIIFLQRSCSGNSKTKDTVTTVIDTVWISKTDTILKIVPIKKIEYVYLKDPKYQPTTDIDTCTKRFAGLVKEFSMRRIYHDTIKMDSLGIKGNIRIIDTVWMNRMYGKRKYIFNIQIPRITETTTITKIQESKRQLYIGGNLFGNKESLVLASPGILYKTKKDQIYQVNFGYSFDGSVSYGLGAYWKIKFKK